MPLVAYNDLPTFERLRQEGRTILPAGRALSQEIREMHIGLLNMMPDAALQATERQFFRLVGESNQIAQFYMHPFTLPEIERGTEAREYVNRYYEPFDKIREGGLDALIISGANVADPELMKAPFWGPLQDVMRWSWDNVTSTLCSCLATHAVMQFRYGQKRQPLPEKLWGVYGHRVLDRRHPLVRGVNTVFDVPHSRHNDISREKFESAGLKVLSHSEEAGAHIAVSPDGFRLVCFQGHPEYDTISLYKEYRREADRFRRGEIATPPPFPENYFNSAMQSLLQNAQKSEDAPLDDTGFHERIENSWRDSGRSIIGNWAGLVYQTTNADRRKQFMDGVDPDHPLDGL
ncbi:MAG: homoserine O-succinyltransferase [Alphaproteobacteria bacterium]|nr:homoserine O-succinyltransferase [Alphaproteobacteria bacterium]